MNFATLKNMFQIITYFGAGLAIVSTIVISLYPNAKINWCFNIQLGVFIAIIGSVVYLIGVIFFNIYSDKVEQENQKIFEKKLAARDRIIKEKTEELLITNRFHAEVDNPVRSMFFILDLGSTPLANNFNDFTCIIRFVNLDITMQFRALSAGNTISENTQFIEVRAVKGKDLNKSPFISVGNSSIKSISELYLDLFLFIKLLPSGFLIRDLNDQSFFFYLTNKHTSFVKEIKINVNNWDIFKKTGNEIHWRELKQDFLPENHDLKIFYQEYQTRFYDYNKIRFFQEGFGFYEIIRSNMDTRSRISANDVKRNLSSVNDSIGTVIFDIDKKWRMKNNAYIEYLPLTTKNGFSIRIYRDSDNILKVFLSFKYAQNVILKCRYPDNFSDSQNIYRLAITWSKENVIFYIDGKVVDKYKVILE